MPLPAADNEFLRARLAAVAALPAEQRSHDEAGFLRGHQLLAGAQESISALEASGLSHIERCRHTQLAMLAWLGGLEELCSCGVDLVVLIQSHANLMSAPTLRDSLALLCDDAAARRLNAAAAAGDVGTLMATLDSQRFAFFAWALLLCGGDSLSTHIDTPAQRSRDLLESAAALRALHTELFSERSGNATNQSILLLQATDIGAPATRHQLPRVEQLRRLWAVLASKWALRVVDSLGHESGMAGNPRPTHACAEALQLKAEALAAMRQLCPSHPLTDRLAAQSAYDSDGGASVASALRHGLEHAAAAGGPHGSSLFTAEFAFGLITASGPTASTPPWGGLTLAEAAQLLQQGDTAWARCKALLLPFYLSGTKHIRNQPSVRWCHAVVKRHQQAGAVEWQEQLVAAEPAPQADALGRRRTFAVTHAPHAQCACCGKRHIELRACSACRLPDAKYCR